MAVKDVRKELERIRKMCDWKRKITERTLKRHFEELLKQIRGILGENYDVIARDMGTGMPGVANRGQLAVLAKKIEFALSKKQMAGTVLLKRLSQEVYEYSLDRMTVVAAEATGNKALARVIKKAGTMVRPEVVRRATLNIVDPIETYNGRWFPQVMRNMREAINRGILNGDTIETVARSFDKHVWYPYQRMVLIARTEVHRIREAGINDAMDTATAAVERANKITLLRRAGYRPNGLPIEIPRQPAVEAPDYAPRLKTETIPAPSTYGQGRTIVRRPRKPVFLSNGKLAKNPADAPYQIPGKWKDEKTIRRALGPDAAIGDSYADRVKPLPPDNTTKLSDDEILDLLEEDGVEELEDIPVMKVMKMWHTHMDERVRHTKRADHRRLNGQKVLQENTFDLGRGIETLYPGGSGDPANDCNCRCFTVPQLVELSSRELSALTKELIST